MKLARLLFGLAVATTLLTVRARTSPLGTAAPLGGLAADPAGGGEITTSDVQMRPLPAKSEAPPAANPLWEIPLSTLTETRARPLFSPSRRPPPAATAARHRPPERLPRRPILPERPPLKLLGTIVGETKGLGLFLDTSSKKMVRLRTGATYHGWVLRTVRQHTVVMEKNHLNQTLSLPTPAETHVQPVAAERPRFRHAPPHVDATDGSHVHN